MASSSQLKSLRQDYDKAKREYRKAGKAAFGKAEGSKPKKEYKAARAAYKKIGNVLGKATGRKTRKGK